jgi:hypothetical protein
MKQVRAAVNDFARSIVPPPPRNPVSLPAFQTFANLLNPRGKGIGPGPHPNPSASPFEMHYEFGPTAIEAEGDQIQTVTRVWIGIVKSAALNTSRVAFTCQVRVQEEESSSGTEWGVDITPAADSGFVYDREHGAYVGELTKERKFSFELKSAPYDALWTVRIRPIITPLDTAEEGKQ